MPILDIGEVAARSGVPASTLRYYEEIGLIGSLGRRGLRRQFDADVLLRLSLIGLGKAAGFSLVEIAGMFGPNGRPDLPGLGFMQRQTNCSVRSSISALCATCCAISLIAPRRRIWNARPSVGS